MDVTQHHAPSAEAEGRLLALMKSAAGQWVALSHVIRTLRISPAALDAAFERLAYIGFSFAREDRRVRLADLEGRMQLARRLAGIQDPPMP